MILALAAALALAAPTRFQVVTDQGRDWLVDPAGKRFLSFGVCVVDPGVPFKEYDPANPSYAAWKSYPDPTAWASDTIGRLQKWGFNTVGAWSDIDHLKSVKTEGMYFTPILHMGSGAGAPWRDMWDPAIVKVMDKIAGDQITPLKNEGRIIGYFSDNEQGWWEGALFDWAWKGAGTRAHLLQVLRSRYPTWDSLLKDFEAAGASSYVQLAKSGRLYLRPGANGMPAVQAYMRVLCGQYYSLCRSIIKHYDPGALYLGDRYISNFYPEVAAASAPYVDVVSTNLNADWNDGTFADFYLPTLEAVTHKPIMITEYYMTAKENRSGNQNNSSGFPTVLTQAQRAEGFTRQTSFFFEHPYVVGAHWFQYYDEPKNGRGDGENYNMGLVDTSNRPYEELTHAASRLDLAEIHNPVGNYQGAFSGMVDTSNLQTWQREYSLARPIRPFPRGDVYIRRDKNNGYIAIYWNEDRFAEGFYKGGKVPEIDRPHIKIQMGGGPIIRVVAGEGGPAKITGPGKILKSIAGVRNTVIVQAPLVRGLRGRATISVRLDTRGRAYTGIWPGTPDFEQSGP